MVPIGTNSLPFLAEEFFSGEDTFHRGPVFTAVFRGDRVPGDGILEDVRHLESIEVHEGSVPNENLPFLVVSEAGNGEIIEQGAKSPLRDGKHLLSECVSGHRVPNVLVWKKE